MVRMSIRASSEFRRFMLYQPFGTDDGDTASNTVVDRPWRTA